MDNESKQVLDTALQGLISRLEKTEKFVLDQAPDVFSQMVQKEKLSNWFWIGFMTVILLLSAPWIPISIHNHIFKYSEHFDEERSTQFLGFFVVGSLLTFISVITIVSCTYNLLYIKMCPKLFLLEQFRELLSPKEKS
jgi:hypothetical protein